MDDYFLEFKFFSGTNEYWFPMLVTQKTTQEAADIKESVKSGLEEQFQKVEANDPRVYKQGLNSNYLDGYINNNFRGKVQSITVNNWNITEAEFKKTIDFNNIESEYAGEDSFTMANIEERIFSIVRLPAWPPVDGVESFIINAYKQPS